MWLLRWVTNVCSTRNASSISLFQLPLQLQSVTMTRWGWCIAIVITIPLNSTIFLKWFRSQKINSESELLFPGKIKATFDSSIVEILLFALIARRYQNQIAKILISVYWFQFAWYKSQVYHSDIINTDIKRLAEQYQQRLSHRQTIGYQNWIGLMSHGT